MRIVGIIPARLRSTRLAHKLLLPLGEVPVVVRTYRQAVRSRLETVVVAADDPAICAAVQRHGGRCLLTEGDFANGTERCMAAFRRLLDEGEAWDGFINIQGDEPFIEPTLIDAVLETMARYPDSIVTAAYPLPPAQAVDPNVVKVVLGADRRALYFSRAAVPYGASAYLGHIGVYGFSAAVVEALTSRAPAPLETIEHLEQLRWLYYGLPVRVIDADRPAPAIDTREDYHQALRMIESHEHRCA